MTDPEYKVVKLVAYAWFMMFCAYALYPVIFLASLVNPSFGFAVSAKFHTIAEDLDKALANMGDVEDEEVEPIPPVINKIM